MTACKQILIYPLYFLKINHITACRNVLMDTIKYLPARAIIAVIIPLTIAVMINRVGGL